MPTLLQQEIDAMPPEKLLSCPFQDEDGNKHSIRIYHDKYGYAGECLDCGFALPVSSTEPLAIKRWNTRASTPSPELVELRKDKERLDWLDRQATIAKWSGTYSDSDYNIKLSRAGAPITTLHTMDDDGSEVDEEIGHGDALRTAIDAAME